MQGMKGMRVARIVWAAVMVLSVASCASVQRPEVRQLPERVELNGVPFFRGNAHQSGPHVLASMFNEQRIGTTPGLLTKPLKLPQAEQALQGNMQALAEQYGLMVYPLVPSLSAVLTQVAAGYPVMVRIADGVVWSTPRYAMVVGYDRHKQTVLLRAGMERRRPMSFNAFESAWKEEGSWAVLLLSPGQLPAQVDKARWLKAAEALARAGQEQASAKAIQTLEAQQ